MEVINQIKTLDTSHRFWMPARGVSTAPDARRAAINNGKPLKSLTGCQELEDAKKELGQIVPPSGEYGDNDIATWIRE
jgi:hypothetical protein